MTRSNLGWLLFGLALCGFGHADPPLVVPGNGGGYDPQLKALHEIRDEVKGVREEVRALRSGTPVKPGADRKLAREQVLVRRCAGCHTPERVEDGKDGGVLIFNDDESKTLRRLKDDGPEAKAIADAVKGGSMPKGRGPLPKPEKELFD